MENLKQKPKKNDTYTDTKNKSGCSCGEHHEERTDQAFTVNKPFRGRQFAANRALSDTDIQKLEKNIPEDETLLFTVSGDLSIKSRYSDTFLAVTDKHIYGFDDTFDGGVRVHSYDKVKRAAVKRYYGNAILIFSMDESDKEFIDLSKEHINFMRFSYKVASLYDAAAFFIQNIAAGKDLQEEMQIVEASFEKQFCICPQCGRNLIRPGAPCMNCQSKDKIVKKLIGYVTPYKTLLIFCMFLSVITTAVSLLPPYMTKLLVDDVLPAGDKGGSVCGACRERPALRGAFVPVPASGCPGGAIAPPRSSRR